MGRGQHQPLILRSTPGEGGRGYGAQSVDPASPSVNRPGGNCVRLYELCCVVLWIKCCGCRVIEVAQETAQGHSAGGVREERGFRQGPQEGVEGTEIGVGLGMKPR